MESNHFLVAEGYVVPVGPKPHKELAVTQDINTVGRFQFIDLKFPEIDPQNPRRYRIVLEEVK